MFLEVCFLFCSFSSAFSSVHGERPSSEYAKIRKESLESQFGRILGSSSRTLFADRGFGPFLAMYRAATISFHVMKLTIWHLLLSDVHKRAEKVFLFCLSSYSKGVFGCPISAVIQPFCTVICVTTNSCVAVLQRLAGCNVQPNTP